MRIERSATRSTVAPRYAVQREPPAGAAAGAAFVARCDGESCSSLPRPASRPRRTGVPACEAEHEAGALPSWGCVRGDATAEALHRRVAEGQAEARPFAGCRGGEERLEEPRPGFRRKPAAVVGHLERGCAVDEPPGQLDGPRTGLGGVDEKV